MTSTHAEYKYSVTIHTDDLPAVYCLRALSQYSQRTGNVRIPSGGTKDPDWLRDDHCVIFRFTCERYREDFIALARRLLPQDLWWEAGRSDTDPATPQGSQRH